MIIETTDNRFFKVRETNDANLAHVWFGVEQKRVKVGFTPKVNARETLVRKAASKIIIA